MVRSQLVELNDCTDALTFHPPGSAVRPRKREPFLRPKLPVPPLKAQGLDVSQLRANRSGIVKMRGKSDKGRRWVQETDLETAVVLVREHAAVVVNRHTIRRLYTNKSFRSYILERDRHTCYFCGEPGDTIDHLLPRAKGGHTTPLNCVCACNLCNQSKADLSFEEFMKARE
ncbi:HNH endonuclease [Paenibacillus turpanensis]|uniref:HNH endonuclease n=1 Tax=Paenibacillus turpanensis TaxID=2689078 RepID=UPI001FB742ED|nr:HNH endonuclease [Paenibacillus turpanensis]